MPAWERGEAGAGTANALFRRYLKMSELSGVNGNVAQIAVGYPVDPRQDELLKVVQRPGVRTVLSAGAATPFLSYVDGITTSDRIISVLHVSTAADNATTADLTHEYSITNTNRITGVTDTANDLLIVTYEIAPADYTSVTKINSKGNIKIQAPLALAAFTAAVFDTTGGAAPNVVVKTDAFLGYAWRPGDWFVPTASTEGTHLTAGLEVIRWVDKDNIQLSGNLASPDTDLAALAGYILRGTKGAKIEIVHTLRGVR